MTSKSFDPHGPWRVEVPAPESAKLADEAILKWQDVLDELSRRSFPGGSPKHGIETLRGDGARRRGKEKQ